MSDRVYLQHPTRDDSVGVPVEHARKRAELVQKLGTLALNAIKQR